MEIEWQSSGTDQVGILAGFDGDSSLPGDFSVLPTVGCIPIRIDPRYFRPTEVEFLQGDASKARKILGWEASVTFHELVKIMVRADIQALLNMQRCQDVMNRIINGDVKGYGKGLRILG